MICIFGLQNSDVVISLGAAPPHYAWFEDHSNNSNGTGSIYESYIYTHITIQPPIKNQQPPEKCASLGF